MKKFSVILLVAVLAMTCVFAEAVPAGNLTFKGSATASYTIGLDKGDLTYAEGTNTGWTSSIAFTAITKGTAYEADKPYAVLGATIKHNACSVTSFALTKFQIVKEDVWTLDFLGLSAVGDFAESFEVKTPSPLTYVDLVDNSLAGDVAFTWTPDADHEYVFVGAANRAADKAGNYTLGAQSPVFTLVEGEERVALDIQGAAGFDYNQDNGWTLDGSIALGSDTKAANIAAAADVALSGIKKDGKLVFDFDARLDASFGPITKIEGKDAYFADLDVYASKTAADKKNLDAKAAFHTNVFNNNTPVTVEVSCLNILADDATKRNLSASADITIAKNYGVGVYAKDILNKGTYGVKGSIVIKNAEDAAKKFTITNTADVHYALATKTIGYEVASVLKAGFIDEAKLAVANSYVIGGDTKNLTVTAYAQTKSLVNGATLKLAYNGLNLLDKKVGNVVASCTVSF